jgi:hypothetical protein
MTAAMTAAIFRAEFRRALPLLPWLLGCHAITLGLRTRWSDEVTPPVAGIVGWATGSLALLVLIGSIWQDSPSRPERFLATRPIAPRPQFFAKLSALLLMVAPPFAAVDLGTLLWAEQSARILFLGTAQTALFAGVAVLAAFPLVGFWRSAPVAFSGLGVAFFAGALVLRLFGNHPLNTDGPRWIALDYLLTPPVLLVALAMAGFLSALSLRLLRRRPGNLLRIAVFTVGICVTLQGALVLRTRPRTSQAAVNAALVSLKYTPFHSADGFATRLDLTPPSEPGDASIVRIREFTRIRVNGRDALRWHTPWDGRSEGSIQSHPVQHALRRHGGAAFQLPAAYHPEDEPAGALIADTFPPDPPLEIAARIRETNYRWQVVADLPLRVGATAVHGDHRWRVRQISEPPGFSGRTGLWVALVETFPKLWLGKHPKAGMNPHFSDLALLLDSSTGELRSMEFISGFPAGDDRRQSLVSRRFFLHHDPSDSFEMTRTGSRIREVEWSPAHRLLILRLKEERTIYYDWRSAGPVLYPSKWLRQPFIDSPKSVRAIDPPLVTTSDAAAVTRNGLGWLTEDLLFQDPGEKVLTEEEWIAFLRLEPTARRYRQLVAGFVPRPVLEREVDRWLAGDPVRLPNPQGSPHVAIDPLLELALARGQAEAPRRLKEAITRNQEDDANYHAVWWVEPVRDAFVVPTGLKSHAEVVDWFMAQDPAAFAFDPALGRFQLR